MLNPCLRADGPVIVQEFGFRILPNKRWVISAGQFILKRVTVSDRLIMVTLFILAWRYSNREYLNSYLHKKRLLKRRNRKKRFWMKFRRKLDALLLAYFNTLLF